MFRECFLPNIFTFFLTFSPQGKPPSVLLVPAAMKHNFIIWRVEGGLLWNHHYTQKQGGQPWAPLGFSHNSHSLLPSLQWLEKPERKTLAEDTTPCSLSPREYMVSHRILGFMAPSRCFPHQHYYLFWPKLIPIEVLVARGKLGKEPRWQSLWGKALILTQATCTVLPSWVAVTPLTGQRRISSPFVSSSRTHIQSYPSLLLFRVLKVNEGGCC